MKVGLNGMSLSKASFLGRSVVPHGSAGVAAPIPADIRRDLGLQSGAKVDIEFDREERTVTYHLRRSDE